MVIGQAGLLKIGNDLMPIALPSAQFACNAVVVSSAFCQPITFKDCQGNIQNRDVPEKPNFCQTARKLQGHDNFLNSPLCLGKSD